jgi:hypothetical protein
LIGSGLLLLLRARRVWLPEYLLPRTQTGRIRASRRGRNCRGAAATAGYDRRAFRRRTWHQSALACFSAVWNCSNMVSGGSPDSPRAMASSRCSHSRLPRSLHKNTLYWLTPLRAVAVAAKQPRSTSAATYAIVRLSASGRLALVASLSLTTRPSICHSHSADSVDDHRGRGVDGNR